MPITVKTLKGKTLRDGTPVRAVLSGQRVPDYVRKSNITTKPGVCAPMQSWCEVNGEETDHKRKDCTKKSVGGEWKKGKRVTNGCFGKFFFNKGQPHIQLCNGSHETGTPFSVTSAADATAKIRDHCRVSGFGKLRGKRHGFRGMPLRRR